MKIVSVESISLFPVTPFCQVAYLPLQQLSFGNLAGMRLVRLSSMLQACAYIYETAAVLGRARKAELAKTLSALLGSGQEKYDLWELKRALKTRLEYTSRDCKSLYTFYLDCTMRNLNMDFSVHGMKQAHNELRTLGEVFPHVDSAGAEGLMIGGSFPDLTEKLYNKRFDAQNKIVREMKAYGDIAREETLQTHIKERERLVINTFKSYFT